VSVVTGYKSADIETRARVEPATVQYTHPNKISLDTLSPSAWYRLGTYTVAAGATSSTIISTGVSTLAKVGDIVVFNDGSSVTGEYSHVLSILGDTLTLAQVLSSAPTLGSTFLLYRLTFLEAGSITGSIATTSLVTFTLTRPTITNNHSDVALAANASRRTGSYIVNHTAYTLYGNYGAAAVLSQGFKILPGQSFLINSAQQVQLIQASGTSINVDIFEAT
jgi:hypothetical protein